MFFKNKQKTLFALVVCLGLSYIGTKASGQNQHLPQEVSHSASGLHHAVVGDNFWDIAFEVYGTGYAWVKILELNPLLPSGQPRKAWIDQKTGFWKCDVVIGEIIVVDKSFWSQPQEIKEDIPLRDTPKATVLDDEAPVKISGKNFPWVYIFLLFFFIGLIYAFFLHKEKKDRIKKEQEKKKEEEEAIRLADLKKREEEKAIRLAESDPIGSGAPQVKGGVTDEQAIARIINIASGINGVNPRFLNVTNIERGRLFGKGETFYADKPNGLTKRFSGEVGYRGMVRRVDGIEQVVYFLQACGNDVRQGNYTEGEEINFVADQEQPEIFVQHNNAVEVQQQEASGNLTSVKLFDWKEKVLDIMEKGAEKDLKFFLNIKIGDSELRFDTTDDKRSKTSTKAN